MATVQMFSVPNTLYRYRSLMNLERELKTLEDNTIYCGEYSKLNDPMEGFFGLGSALAETPTSGSVRQAIVDMTASVGIGSFCEAYDNELMWAHYADQFRGICIAYNFRELLGELPDDVYFARLYYTERIPVVGISRQEPENLAKRVLSYKNHRWAYEREWRMFAPKGAVPYKTRKSIRHVYLGYRAADEERKAVEDRLAKLNIPLKPMSLDGYAIAF